MIVLVVGCCLLVLGLAGLRYAPAIVQAQTRQGMAPFEDDSIDEIDRIRVTKGASIVLLVVGSLLVAYAVSPL